MSTINIFDWAQALGIDPTALSHQLPVYAFSEMQDMFRDVSDTYRTTVGPILFRQISSRTIDNSYSRPLIVTPRFREHIDDIHISILGAPNRLSADDARMPEASI